MNTDIDYWLESPENSIPDIENLKQRTENHPLCCKIQTNHDLVYI